MEADSVNVKAQEELKAAVSAKAQLRHLTSSSVRADRMIFRLRHAANVAATATLNRLDSERALDPISYEAAKSLNAVCRLLYRRHLPKTFVPFVDHLILLNLLGRHSLGRYRSRI